MLISLCLVWFSTTDAWKRQFGDMSIYGSHPPTGVHVPNVSGIKSDPKFTIARAKSAVVFITCTGCPQGIVMGQFLSRMDMGKLDNDVNISVLLLGDDAVAWKRRFILPRRVRIHVVAPNSTHTVRKLWHLPTQGAAGFVYNRRGIWRSTFLTGQLRASDIVHDAAVVDAEA